MIIIVTFGANGGNGTRTSKNETNNIIYGEPPEVNRTECAFIGGFTVIKTNKTGVINETIISIPHDHTLYVCLEEILKRTGLPLILIIIVVVVLITVVYLSWGRADIVLGL